MSEVVLTKPIIGIDGSEITKIEVAEITGRMYLQYGDIMRSEVRTDGNVETVFVGIDKSALKSYMTACTNQPIAILENMSPADLMEIRTVIEGFFTDFQAPGDT